MKKPRLTLRRILLFAIVAVYLVMWIGGVGHYALLGRPPLDAPWAASVFLLLAGVIAVVTSPRKNLIGLFIASGLGFIAEIIGVRYGFIFSPYRYTEVLQPQFFGVPLVMLSAWMVLVAYVRQMLMSRELPLWAEAIFAAVWMTAIDLVIDPLAANQLNYWRWEQTSDYYGIPLHNFIGWFVVSFFIFLIVKQRWRINRAAHYVGLSIILFFTAIALSLGLFLAGAIGIGLCLLDWGMGFRERDLRDSLYLPTP